MHFPLVSVGPGVSGPAGRPLKVRSSGRGVRSAWEGGQAESCYPQSHSLIAPEGNWRISRACTYGSSMAVNLGICSDWILKLFASNGFQSRDSRRSGSRQAAGRQAGGQAAGRQSTQVVIEHHTYIHTDGGHASFGGEASHRAPYIQMGELLRRLGSAIS